jgi:sulfite reductase alpha subunit-like flavoprotein
MEKEQKEKEMKNIQSLLPKQNNYDDKVIPGFTIFYATQSNTSRRFAEKIQNDAKTLNLNAFIKNISEITLSDFENNMLLVFLISTYGEGGPTDDSIEFDKFLEKNKNGIKKDDVLYLKDLNYCVFGLGSRKYENFNAMAKKLDKVLMKSGCNR